MFIHYASTDNFRLDRQSILRIYKDSIVNKIFSSELIIMFKLHLFALVTNANVILTKSLSRTISS